VEENSSAAHQRGHNMININTNGQRAIDREEKERERIMREVQER
jgi:hypothetical protein